MKTQAETLKIAQKALEQAKYAIKGREHTGFIDSALSALATVSDASPSPVSVQPSSTRLNANESDPIALWAEVFRLRASIQGPDGYATWQDAATAERIRRVKAEQSLAAAAQPISSDAQPVAISNSERLAFHRHVRDTIGWTEFAKVHTKSSGRAHEEAFFAGFRAANAHDAQAVPAVPGVAVIANIRKYAEELNAEAIADGFACSETAYKLFDLLDAVAPSAPADTLPEWDNG